MDDVDRLWSGDAENQLSVWRGDVLLKPKKPIIVQQYSKKARTSVYLFFASREADHRGV